MTDGLVPSCSQMTAAKTPNDSRLASGMSRVGRGRAMRVPEIAARIGMNMISAATGLILVYTQPMRFWGNIIFWIKTTMMVLAADNVLAFHYGTYRSVASWDSSARVPFGAKLSSVVSLVLWSLVIISGRLIAYNRFQ